MARYSTRINESIRSTASSGRVVAQALLGRGITEIQDFGPEQIKIELGADTNLRVTWTPAGLLLDLVSSAPAPEFPRLMLELDIDSRQLNFSTAERQLKAFVNLYAIARLLLENRLEPL